MGILRRTCLACKRHQQWSEPDRLRFLALGGKCLAVVSLLHGFWTSLFGLEISQAWVSCVNSLFCPAHGCTNSHFFIRNLHFSLPKRWNWRNILHFFLPKNRTLVSSLLNCTEFTLSVAKNVALFEAVCILRKICALRDRFTSVKWRDRGSKHRSKRSNFRLHRPSSHRKKWIKLIPKTIGNRKKEIVCEVALGGLTSPEKIFRSKSTNQEGIRSAHRTDLCFSIWRFSQVMLNPERNLTHNLFFLFPIVFGINFDLTGDGPANGPRSDSVKLHGTLSHTS